MKKYLKNLYVFILKNIIYSINLHRSLSINLPAHKVANATLIENTRIFPTLSLKQTFNYKSMTLALSYIM